MFLPVKPIDEINGFELKLRNNYYLFYEDETPFNNSSSASIVVDKYCINQLLEMEGIPVPKAIFLHIEEFQQEPLEEKIASLKFPLVIKAVNGSLDMDVLCNIQTFVELKAFLTDYFSLYSQLIIEEFHGKLKSYRVLVFNKRVIGIILRHPATVVGDGTHNLKELIEVINMQRKKTNDALGQIVIDDECHIKLRELGIGEDYTPSSGEEIALYYNCNETRGGTYETLGKNICKENRQLMVRIASLLNLKLMSIDVECSDINTPLEHSNAVIIEVNDRPCMQIHELPTRGRPNRVTKKIMRSLIYRHPLTYLFGLLFK